MTTVSSSQQFQELPAKVQQWLQYVEKQISSKRDSSSSSESPVPTIYSVAQAIDLTTNPSTIRASFPHPLLPPLYRISYENLMKQFLCLPSIGVTALGSFLSGAVFVAGYFAMNYGRAVRSLRSNNAAGFASSSSLSRPLQVIVSLIGAILLLKWLSTRLPKRQKLSSSFNVSSHPEGPCMVTGPVVTISNSHAGTHADTPAHFVQCGNKSEASSPTSPLEFHKSCYSGDCVILDISQTLASRGNKEIDEAVLVDAVARHGNSSSNTSAFDWSSVWRLIICSKRLDADRDQNDAWKNDFAYFTPAGANFLAHQCPRLMMIGTDAPSVDRSDASPLIKNSHGVFWNHRIAIVENINCAPVYDRFASETILSGQVQCVFNEAQKFEDAEGCNVLFYPAL